MGGSEEPTRGAKGPCAVTDGLCLRTRGLAAAGVLLLALVGPVRAQAPVYTHVALLDRVHDVEWQLPAGAPRGWMWLQHGFGRHCANLRATAQRAVAVGFATACINADMAGGAPALAAALAKAMLADEPALRPPDAPSGAAVRWLLAGHSAGALFAARLGLGLAQADPASVAGVLLLDPVGGRELGDALLALSADGRRPAWAVLAPPSRCNAQQLALAALSRLRTALRAAGGSGFVGLQMQAGATHLDAEGQDTEALAVWACGEGWPQPARTQDLRDLLAAWAPLAWAAGAQEQAGTDPVTQRLLRAGLAKGVD